MSIQIVSAEDQIEQIIEQARIVERKSVNRMAFLKDVSALYLLGLRQLAREIDQFHDPLDFVPPASIEAPSVESPELAAHFADLTLQITKMTEDLEKRSVDLENRAVDLEKRAEDLEKRAEDLEKRAEDLEKRAEDLENHSNYFKKLSKRRKKG
jgi:TolA-binding protein